MTDTVPTVEAANPEGNNESLCSKIEGIFPGSLTEDQKEGLLRAILGLARGITNSRNDGTPPSRSLSEDFAAAFQPLSTTQVDRLMQYQSGPPMIVQQPEVLAALNNVLSPGGVTIEIHGT
jgi:hypothetical protein